MNGGIKEVATPSQKSQKRACQGDLVGLRSGSFFGKTFKAGGYDFVAAAVTFGFI